MKVTSVCCSCKCRELCGACGNGRIGEFTATGCSGGQGEERDVSRWLFRALALASWRCPKLPAQPQRRTTLHPLFCSCVPRNCGLPHADTGDPAAPCPGSAGWSWGQSGPAAPVPQAGPLGSSCPLSAPAGPGAPLAGRALLSFSAIARRIRE